MAHKKGQGSIRNGRDSKAKRLGCKRFAGEFVGAATSWFVSVALTSIPVRTWVAARTTPCSLCAKVR